MFDNVGGKIKALVKIIFAIETAVAILVGIFLIFSSFSPLPGLLVMTLGPILAWISSWLLYGFGEIIEKSIEIEENTRRMCNMLECRNITNKKDDK